MTHDFSHAAMHRLADWPVLARLVAKSSGAKRLDSRSVAAIYASRASPNDLAEMTESERNFALECIAAHSVAPDPRVVRRAADIPHEEGNAIVAELERMMRKED